MIFTDASMALFVKEGGFRAATRIMIIQVLQQQTGPLVAKLSHLAHEHPHIKEMICGDEVMSGMRESTSMHHDGEVFPFQVEVRKRPRCDR